MDVDVLDETNGHSPDIRENGLPLRPVLPQETGEGLPYAPVDFPEQGDRWGWRVGRRTTASGYYVDRYLYLPNRIRKSARVKGGFASKLSAKQYIRERFPDADIDALFASFSWKIPSKHVFLTKDLPEERLSFSLSSEDNAEQSLSDHQSVDIVCKAGNKRCPSLMDEVILGPAASMPCDVCCSEPDFCRDCCCILCCKIIKLHSEGYSFIRCEARTFDGFVCGHAAHINCALRSYMAGTVGGSIGLDAEYFCRRCDSRTDLVKHVNEVLGTCDSMKSEDVGKMLKLSVCILRGSHKEGARRLLNRVELALQKSGSELKDICEVEENPSTGVAGDNQRDRLDSGMGLQNRVPAGTTIINREAEYLRVEKEIDQVLYELKNSQEYEYRVAQERLHSQKDYIFSLYDQLEQKKTELKSLVSRHNVLQSAVADKEEHLKREVGILKEMGMVAKGFGRMPPNILKSHFDLNLEE